MAFVCFRTPRRGNLQSKWVAKTAARPKVVWLFRVLVVCLSAFKNLLCGPTKTAYLQPDRCKRCSPLQDELFVLFWSALGCFLVGFDTAHTCFNWFGQGWSSSLSQVSSVKCSRSTSQTSSFDVELALIVVRKGFPSSLIGSKLTIWFGWLPLVDRKLDGFVQASESVRSEGRRLLQTFGAICEQCVVC